MSATIGNRLTYTNDLPGTLGALALSAGDTARSVAEPNFAIFRLSGRNDFADLSI
jgi:hypothetical protein